MPTTPHQSTTETADAPLGLRERSRRERSARILAAAATLFDEKGYDVVTTKEIAARANVGEATLFRHVSHKSDLLMLVIGQRQDALLDALMAADDEVSSARPELVTAAWFTERIANIYRSRIGFYTLDPEHVAKYVLIGFQHDSEVGASSIRAGDRVTSRITAILTEAQLAGVLRNDVTAEVVARNLNATYIHEVLRSPARHLPIEEAWQRLEERLNTALTPLNIEHKDHHH